MGTGSTLRAVLNDFSLKLCHTPRTKLTTPFASNYSGNTPLTVYSANPVTIVAPANTWFGFDCNPSFEYNGRDNLLVETWWDGGNDGGPNCWMANVSGSDRACVASRVNGVPQNGYPNGGKVEGYNFNMRITLTPNAVAPTSLGRLRALYR
ncbi:MAG: hypothetical protein JSU81_10320 [Candidatus Coatesbacteria bacterium]|nr:MAG: hypothetical protein JSU81_10320 [Candidatus Coatesbacteria bacterium]